jgi:hypothetical protein
MLYSILLSEAVAEGGGIGWMVWVALAIFLVMVFLGWLVSSKGWLRKEEEPVQVHHDDHGQHEVA